MRHDSKKLNRIMTRSIWTSLVLFACLACAPQLALAQQPVTVTNPDGSITVTQPDGSSTTRDIPDSTYGSGGTRDEKKDPKRRVVRSVWKDSKGRVLVSFYRWPNLGVFLQFKTGLGTTVTHPDGSTTTTGIPDDRYGSGGTRDEEMDAKERRVRERSWKDRRGTTLEDEFTYYGAKDKNVVTTLYNPKPGGGTRRGRQTITKTDLDGKEISTETLIYTDGIETSRTKTEVDRSGRKRNYKWDPQKGYVEVATNVTPQTARQGESSSAPGFAVASEVAGGLNTTTFATPRGKIRVNLPDDMAAGDTLSGTVIAEPQGKDDKERAANKGELNGYVVEMEKQQASSTSRILKLAIPAASSATHLILKDKEGKEVARIEVPVALQVPPAEEFDLPTMGQQDRLVEVRGRFDGDFRTTNLKVGGEGLEVLAESPRKVVVRNTSNKIGPTELAVEEQGRTARGEFRSLGLSLSAPKLDLLKGEQTTLTVKVLGLEGLKEPVPLVLENKSAGVISMGNGNLEQITVSPSQVQGGTYTTERSLTGIQRGAFTITATVVSSGRRLQ